jgi:hypothetical protein
VLVQAKRYNGIVPASAVRDRYGTMVDEGARSSLNALGVMRQLELSLSDSADERLPFRRAEQECRPSAVLRVTDCYLVFGHRDFDATATAAECAFPPHSARQVHHPATPSWDPREQLVNAAVRRHTTRPGGTLCQPDQENKHELRRATLKLIN